MSIHYREPELDANRLGPMNPLGLDSCGRSRIRILLADDHQNVRQQMSLRLGRERDFHVVAEAVNSAQVVERSLALKPQIALIDPMMRDGLGLQTVGWMAGNVPETAVVVLTAVADTALQMELKKMGVCRILNKGIASSELVEVLRDLGQFAQRFPTLPT